MKYLYDLERICTKLDLRLSVTIGSSFWDNFVAVYVQLDEVVSVLLVEKFGPKSAERCLYFVRGYERGILDTKIAQRDGE